jgi:hypothetical protein
VYSDVALSFRERETRDRISLMEEEGLPTFPPLVQEGVEDLDTLGDVSPTREDRVRRAGRDVGGLALDDEAPDESDDDLEENEDEEAWDSPRKGELSLPENAVVAVVDELPGSSKG